MAYEYSTPSLVQAELQSSTAFSSSTLPTLDTVNTWIQEESAYVNSLAETVFSTTAISTSDPEYIDYDGGDVLFLEYAPITSITRLRYNKNKLGSSLGTDWVEKTEDTDFYTKNDMGILNILRNNWNPKTGFKRIEVAYVYGYSSVPDEVQKLTTKLVAKRAIEALLFKNVNERNDGGTTSVGSITIVEPESYGVGTYQELVSDIAQLKVDVVDTFKPLRNSFHWYTQ